MSLNIHTIKAAVGTKTKRKRVGRGNSSGHGTYSGRGLKGQKSRAGVSNLKRLGMKQVLLRTPKVRGFKSDKPKNQVVNLSDLNIHYSEGESVNLKSLLAKKLVDDSALPIKVLGKGTLKVAKLNLSGLAVSGSAREQIEKSGGRIL